MYWNWSQKRDSDQQYNDYLVKILNEPRHDKTNNVAVRPAKTQISLGIRPVWSESSRSEYRKLGSVATHWAHSEDSDQTGRMPRLIWVFAGRTLTLLVLSCRGSNALIKWSHVVIHHVGFWMGLLRTIVILPNCSPGQGDEAKIE